MKVSTNFSLSEFVCKDIYARFGNDAVWFIDRRLIDLAQFIRDHFALSMSINTGSLQHRGFREPDYKEGAIYSQHRFGRAIDFNISGLSSEAVFDEIVKNDVLFMRAGLTTIEDIAFTPTWTHCDIRHTGRRKLFIVKP